jgi:hypothetical protein
MRRHGESSSQLSMPALCGLTAPPAHHAALTPCGLLLRAYAATQVSSRLWVLWGLINLEPERTTGSSVQVFELQGISFHLDLFSLLTAWCITEVIRYGFFACKVRPEGRGEGQQGSAAAWPMLPCSGQ